MRRRGKVVLGVVIVLFAAIQLWPVERTNPDQGSDIQTPVEVTTLFITEVLLLSIGIYWGAPCGIASYWQTQFQPGSGNSNL